MANDACNHYIQESIVCPTHLLQNVFTSSNVDNIDHNPRSISSKDSFHESYSNLPLAVVRFSEPDIPLVEGELSIDMSSFLVALKVEFKWFKDVEQNSQLLRLMLGQTFHGCLSYFIVARWEYKLPPMSALLSLFLEQAKSVTIIHLLSLFVAVR
ncbi:unnamed protein product [Mytilus coruscus]|uniref:Uncharacterized protein n=1 Tax=Mytilus coruscus TaxID=42192 RepID=A0A6J8ELA3_MYTCO|nr:unnamed protein product [Mytilus coruscus]